MKGSQKWRTIFDDHRDAAMYKEAIKILTLILEEDNVAVPEFEDPLLAHIDKNLVNIPIFISLIF